MREEDYPDALPAGYRLHWYVLEHVLGQGGFGITYLARDTNLDRRVAIKEYLPSEIARRRSDAAAHPRTEAQAERYNWGLDRFLTEARTLARFTHPNIVQVHSVFEANNTAYMVMRFEEGENLSRLLDRQGTLTERQLMELLLPILDGLQLVHTAGFIHRDIKPANIYVRQDGTPVLLDFGSARQGFGSTKTMTILVAPGYAPLEQYYNEGATQGAWTDIYGLGATCYRAIAGRAPLDAIVRAKGVLGSARELLQPAVEAGRGRYSAQLLAAVDHALQLSERDRPQDLASWRAELTSATAFARTVCAPEPSPAPTQAPIAAAQPRLAEMAAPLAAATPSTPAAQARPRSAALWPAVAAVSLLVGSGAVVYAWRAPGTAAAPQPLAAQPPVQQSAAAVLPTPEAGAPAQPASSPAAIPAPAPVAATKAVPAPRGAPRLETAAPPAPAPRPPVAPPAAATLDSTAALTRPAPPPDPLPVVPPAAPAPAASPAAAAPAARNEQIDAADAALRRGDHATAAQLLAPWAAAGVTRALLLLAQVQEARTGRQHSDFEAYVWYGIAARMGEPAAPALRDKVAPRLQPAEVQQANRIIEHWRARPDAVAAGAR